MHVCVNALHGVVPGARRRWIDVIGWMDEPVNNSVFHAERGGRNLTNGSE